MQSSRKLGLAEGALSAKLSGMFKNTCMKFFADGSAVIVR